MFSGAILAMAFATASFVSLAGSSRAVNAREQVKARNPVKKSDLSDKTTDKSEPKKEPKGDQRKAVAKEFKVRERGLRTVAAVVPDFAEEAKRRQIETLKANAQAGGQAKAAKNKGLPLVKKLTKGTEEPRDDANANKAIAQAIDRIAPDKTNRTYVTAVLKEAGYDAKKNSFKQPLRTLRIGYV